MKISFKKIQFAYPGCDILSVEEFYHPERRWTNRLNNGEIVHQSSNGDVEQQVVRCIQDGATMIQFKLQNHQEFYNPYFKVEDLTQVAL